MTRLTGHNIEWTNVLPVAELCTNANVIVVYKWYVI